MQAHLPVTSDVVRCIRHGPQGHHAYEQHSRTSRGSLDANAGDLVFFIQ